MKEGENDRERERKGERNRERKKYRRTIESLKREAERE